MLGPKKQGFWLKINGSQMKLLFHTVSSQTFCSLSFSVIFHRQVSALPTYSQFFFVKLQCLALDFCDVRIFFKQLKKKILQKD